VIAPTNLAFATGSVSDPITLDTSASSSVATSTNTVNWPITIGAGANRALFVSMFNGSGVITDCFGTTVTLGGQSFTRIRRDTYPSGGNLTEWCGLANPTSGAGTITANTAGSCFFLRGFAIAFNNVSQSSLTGTDNGTLDQVGSSTISTSVTNLIDNAWVLDAALTANGDGLTVGAGQTQRFNSTFSVGGFDQTAAASSVGPLAASVTQAMQWSQNPPAAQKDYVQSVITLRPSSSGSGGTSVIQWTDNSADETGFVGEWKHDGTGGAFVPLFSVGPNVTEYPNPITTETNVTIRVRAVRGSDVSDWIMLSTVPPTEPAPEPEPPVVAPPTGTPLPPTTSIPVETTPSGKLVNGRTVVSWNTPNLTESTISQYVVEWTNYKLGTNGWQAIGVTAPNATGFVHRYTPFVPAGETDFWVSYRVKATTAAGLSSYSDPITAQVDVYVPASPPSVQVPSAPSAVSLQ